MTIRNAGSTTYLDDANDLERIAAFGRDPEWALRGTSLGDGPLDSAARAWALMQRLNGDLREGVASIDKDGDLSSKGRDKAKAARAEKTLADLAPVRRATAKIGAEVEKLNREAQSKLTPADTLLAYLQAQEARAWLGSDALSNLVIANQAALDSDTATLSAILDAPASWPGKPDEAALAGLREQRLAFAVGPEATEETQLLAQVHRDLTVALGITETGIHEAAGLSSAKPNDNVARLAAGPGPESSRTIAAEAGDRVA